MPVKPPPPAIVRPAPVMTVRINGKPYEALLCDTPATRNRGLAGTPKGSPRCCIMVWHHQISKTILGAKHLFQPYLICEAGKTRPSGATVWSRGVLHPGGSLLVNFVLTGQPKRPRPTLLEVPASLSGWAQLSVAWKFPLRDVQYPPAKKPKSKPPAPPKPNESQ